MEGKGRTVREEGGGYNTFGGSGGDGDGDGGSSSSSSPSGGGTGRPWGELIDRRSFAKPASIRDAFARINKNVRYFRRNYAILMLVLVGLSLLWRPVSLIVLAVLTAAWIYFFFSRPGPFVIFNRPISENIMLAFLAVVTIVALAFTPSAGTFLLVSILLGLAIILIHGAFRTPDASYPELQEESSLLGKNAGKK